MAKKRILDGIHPNSQQRVGHVVRLNVRDVQELYNAWQSADAAMRRYHSENEELRSRIRRLEKPIDMVLFCPACGLQHVDEPERPRNEFPYTQDKDGIRHPVKIEPAVTPEWTNPPHRSHLCHECGHIWRPADVATNGVTSIKTSSQADVYPAIRVRAFK